MVRVILTALALSVLVQGCAANPHALDAWKGHTIDEMIGSFGVPNSSSKLAGGKTLYQWEKGNSTYRLIGTNTGTSLRNVTTHCVLQATTLPNRVIEDVVIEGTGCK